MSLRWSTEKPTEEGWYWMRCHPYGGSLLIVWVFARPDGKKLGYMNISYKYEDFSDEGCEWAGPIPTPLPRL